MKAHEKCPMFNNGKRKQNKKENITDALKVCEKTKFEESSSRI
jgi:hypothetical protein